ncbi:MAG: O-antigen ligase family protein [Candidatus Krumholzibacteriales bacterium]
MTEKAFYIVIGLFLASSLFSIALEQTTYALALILWLIMIIRGGGEKPGRTVLDIPLAVFVAATLLAAAFSDDPAGSLRATRNYLMIPVIYLIGFSIRRREAARKLGVIFLAAAAVSALCGIIIFVLSEGDGGLKRAAGTFSMPLTFGGIMMLACSIFFPLSMKAGSRPAIRALLVAGTLLTASALFLSFTRSSWLGMLLSALISIFLLRRKLILPFAAAVVIFILVLPGEYRSRVTSIWDPDYPSNRQRIELIKGGWGIFRDNFLFGTGPGDLAREYEEHMPRGAEVIHGHMHNTFLHIAATRGIIGLLAFLWFVVSVYRLLISVFRMDLPSPENGWVAGSIGAFTGFLINGLFEWNFGDAEVITVLYIIIGSIILLETPGRGGEKGGRMDFAGNNLS